MTKLVALMACVAVAVGLQVATFIYGWGLTPQSWPRIIGLGVASMGWAAISQRVVKEK